MSLVDLSALGVVFGIVVSLFIHLSRCAEALGLDGRERCTELGSRSSGRARIRPVIRRRSAGLAWTTSWPWA